MGDKALYYILYWRDRVSKGYTPLLITYFTEKDHNIWDSGEARGRLLLAKIVVCSIPYSINLYGCIGYIYCRNYLSIIFMPVWMGNKKYCYFHEIRFPKWWWCQTRYHNFLNQWLTSQPPQTQLGMLSQDGSSRLYWLKCKASVQLNVIKK